MMTRHKAGTGGGTRESPPDLARNLIYLCGFYPSISEVCRQIGINRQQFNKYTSGTVMPSLFILKRIADFFGLEVEEICLPHNNLRAIFQIRKSPAATKIAVSSRLLDDISLFSQEFSEPLDKYEGYYYRYYYAYDLSGRVVRSLFRLSKSEGFFVTRHIERIFHPASAGRHKTAFKYSGFATGLSNCIFVVEFESLMKSCIANAVFPIIPRPGQRYLFGLQTSLSTTLGRPAASRVVLERIRPNVAVRKMLARCGTFEPDSPELETDLLHLIGNENLREDAVVMPRII
ncbi:XRE family transcriptional regulator [Pseudaminobacter arsenicus]|uniref:XRE family transcriptional regulator n=1 Tax=Borborobacter arsenicus TaxID=1851146 RepID=A0A432V0W2_9HYPH|nr:XRE family transcriptional regulator [Pseudaminobacter arsenicus]